MILFNMVVALLWRGACVDSLDDWAAHVHGYNADRAADRWTMMSTMVQCAILSWREKCVNYFGGSLLLTGDTTPTGLPADRR